MSRPRSLVRRECSVTGCGGGHAARGLCNKHLKRLVATGTTDAPARASDEQRFWANVNRNGPVVAHMETPCWLWCAAQNLGYGSFRAGSMRDGSRRQVVASRFAWEEAHGDIPPGLCVCHHCDNPPCVRPDHMFIGTHADNVADKVAKGRQPRGLGAGLAGELNGRAKLTNGQVAEIRALLAAGRTRLSIAPEFGVVRSTIDRIARREGWVE